MCINPIIDSWWTTHWCINYLFSFLLTKRCVNIGIFKWQIISRFSYQEYIMLPHPSLFSSFPCFCNKFISVGFCRCNILQLSFVLIMFIFGVYKYYTDILSLLYLISCDVLYIIQVIATFKGWTLNLGEPPKCA